MSKITNYFLQKSAEQGDPVGQCALGNCYFNGNGVPQDYVQAAQWYRKSAEQGDADGQFSLGYLYFKGEGVSQNKIIAYALINLAAAQQFSTDNLASIFRTKISQNMTAQEIEAGQALATEIFRSSSLHAIDEY
jgi:TPR repeat protein